MAKRICERVQIGTDVNGKPIYEWVTGYSRQEVFLNAAAILQKYGQIEGGPQKEPPKTPYFEAYMPITGKKKLLKRERRSAAFFLPCDSCVTAWMCEKTRQHKEKTDVVKSIL